jgi:hypothetical protein
MAGKRSTRLMTIGDVSRYLGKLINKVERGETEGSQAGRLAYIANILISALKDGPLEDRVTKLEKQAADIEQGKS